MHSIKHYVLELIFFKDILTTFKIKTLDAYPRFETCRWHQKDLQGFNSVEIVELQSQNSRMNPEPKVFIQAQHKEGKEILRMKNHME